VARKIYAHSAEHLMLFANSDKEHIKRTKKLMDKGNAEAFNLLAGCYHRGVMGMPQDYQKAVELSIKAGELGCSYAYNNLGMYLYYDSGLPVQISKKEAIHYYELAAMGGFVDARHNLGVSEWEKGNKHRGIKHFMIAARGGHEKSLGAVKIGFKKGLVTKDEYANTLRAYQTRQDEMKSDERDKAAASDMFISFTDDGQYF